MLEIKDISLKVNGQLNHTEILKNISFTFEDRKLYVITGPNGGGKSSLAKIIMGIYKPESGKLMLDNIDITNLDITQRALAGIGYAFQQPPRFKGITVKELLDLASGTKNTKKDVCGLLIDVGLCAEDYLNREIDASLSGGELKRIEIATILARKLKVAVFDEPEAGIDLWSFQKLGETFKTIHQKYDTTIIIISHQERILNLADEVIVLADGMIKEVTTKDKILADIAFDSSECHCDQKCGRGMKNDAECNR